MSRLRKLLRSAKLHGPPTTAEPLLRLDEEGAQSVTVTQEAPGEWRLSGERIEKAAAMTNWDYHEAQVGCVSSFGSRARPVEKTAPHAAPDAHQREWRATLLIDQH